MTLLEFDVGMILLQFNVGVTLLLRFNVGMNLLLQFDVGLTLLLQFNVGMTLLQFVVGMNLLQFDVSMTLLQFDVGMNLLHFDVGLTLLTQCVLKKPVIQIQLLQRVFIPLNRVKDQNLNLQWKRGGRAGEFAKVLFEHRCYCLGKIYKEDEQGNKALIHHILSIYRCQGLALHI